MPRLLKLNERRRKTPDVGVQISHIRAAKLFFGAGMVYPAIYASPSFRVALADANQVVGAKRG